LREKIDWCKVGEWSALYDVLLVSEDLRAALAAWPSFLVGGDDGFCGK